MLTQGDWRERELSVLTAIIVEGKAVIAADINRWTTRLLNKPHSS
jgi:hypothetical protein